MSSKSFGKVLPASLRDNSIWTCPDTGKTFPLSDLESIAAHIQAIRTTKNITKSRNISTLNELEGALKEYLQAIDDNLLSCSVGVDQTSSDNDCCIVIELIFKDQPISHHLIGRFFGISLTTAYVSTIPSFVASDVKYKFCPKYVVRLYNQPMSSPGFKFRKLANNFKRYSSDLRKMKSNIITTVENDPDINEDMLATVQRVKSLAEQLAQISQELKVEKRKIYDFCAAKMYSRIRGDEL